MKRMMHITTHVLLLLIITAVAAFSKAEPAKIYLIGSTLIRSTPGKEIRFYNIANPRYPISGARIAIPGNHDVAVVDDYLYADNNNDMVIFNLINRAKPVAVDTIRNVFNNVQMLGRDVLDYRSETMLSQRGRISNATGDASQGARTGTGGSLARFAVVGNYLYCIDSYSLKVFDITDPWRPQYKNTVQVGAAIETLFPFKDKLFIGGQFGMYIFNAANPEVPVWMSQFTHIRSCDPVVVEGNRAYVTLRGGSTCGGAQNELHILDISNLNAPQLLRTVRMRGPYGLTVRDNVVMVCDGDDGIVVMDASNPGNVDVIGRVTGIVPYDVILDGNLLVVTAESGLYLYDARNLAAPKLYGRVETGV